MTTLYDVRAELANIAETLNGWAGTMYVGDLIDAPVIKVSRPAFDPRMVFGQGKRRVTFRCTAYCKRTETEWAEEMLDALAEPPGTDGSFINAVQDSTNWSITVDFAQVVNVGEVFLTQFGTDTAEYLACPFDVEVVW